MKKLLGKNINHTNSNKKRGEKPNSLVTKSPHKVSTFVQQHGSDGCYSFCVHAEKENGKNKIQASACGVRGGRRGPKSSSCEADVAVRNRAPISQPTLARRTGIPITDSRTIQNRETLKTSEQDCQVMVDDAWMATTDEEGKLHCRSRRTRRGARRVRSRLITHQGSWHCR